MKTQTFKQNKDFKRMYGRGKCFVFPAVVVYLKKNNLSLIRYGITVSKKIGCAVKRNRAKRVIRQAFFNQSGLLCGGYDIVFVARSRATTVKSYEIEACLKKVFKNPEK